MTVHVEGEIRNRRRRKRWDSTARIAVLSLGFLLIFSRICLLSSAEKIDHGGQRWSPARKARFHGHARASSPSSQMVSTEKNNNENLSSSDKTLYDEEKRLVHTGPNPLHN